MANIDIKELLQAGTHFGHLTHKWNPNMAEYIYKEYNGIHVINLYKTVSKLQKASEALKKIATSGGVIMFVATKKQAQKIVSEKAESVNMPYVTERWLGGMLTNFSTIRRSIKKMNRIDGMKKDGSFDTLSKKEQLLKNRLKIKLKKVLGSIENLNRLPSALFIVDVKKEHIAVKEALKLKIPIFAMVDTNSDPSKIDYPIPANDDASKSIDKVVSVVTTSIKEGLDLRVQEKEKKEENVSEKTEETKKVEDVKAEEKAPKKEVVKEEKPKTEKKEAPKKKTEASKTTKTEEKKEVKKVAKKATSEKPKADTKSTTKEK